MTIQTSPVQSYRDDFSFRNSPAAIRRFPFPFTEDSYLYSVNIEPATSRDPGSVYQYGFDIDEHYRSEAMPRACPANRWSSSPVRCWGTSPCSISATVICTWTPVWSPARPTGPWP